MFLFILFSFLVVFISESRSMTALVVRYNHLFGVSRTLFNMDPRKRSGAKQTFAPLEIGAKGLKFLHNFKSAA